MNPTLFSTASTSPSSMLRFAPVLPGLARSRALVAGLLLAGAMATTIVAPPASAQAESPQESAGEALTVNINTADAQILSERLSGIGQSRAEAIIRYREMYGPFESVDELIDVSGVGEGTLARNRAAITLE